MIESYPGHSGTDMVVCVPEQNVVYTGDVLVNGWYPACLDEKTTVSGWRATLKTFASWDKDTLFVPGHGQLCGQRGIAAVREVFDDIAEQAGKMFNAGVPAEEAQHRYVVSKKFKKFLEINGRRMAYIDEGEGAPIVFAHGNPTSSYLWRNVMPACRGLGRLIACDMIGMGDSEKLPDSGPDRYTYAEQRSFLFALWKKLGVGKDVVFVLHDWGSLLGFDWTHQHPERVQGIAYMEALVQPITWADWPENERSIFQGFRGKDGETLVLEKNLIVENVLAGAILRRLSKDEMAAYRAPFANAGEDRRPTLTWLRQIPIEGETPEVVRVATDCGRWLAESRIPKLFINAEPGAALTGRHREFCRTWRNQTEVTVEGIHFVQEDSPKQIGKALAAFVRSLRSL